MTDQEILDAINNASATQAANLEAAEGRLQSQIEDIKQSIIDLGEEQSQNLKEQTEALSMLSTGRPLATMGAEYPPIPEAPKSGEGEQ